MSDHAKESLVTARVELMATREQIDRAIEAIDHALSPTSEAVGRRVSLDASLITKTSPPRLADDQPKP